MTMTLEDRVSSLETRFERFCVLPSRPSDDDKIRHLRANLESVCSHRDTVVSERNVARDEVERLKNELGHLQTTLSRVRQEQDHWRLRAIAAETERDKLREKVADAEVMREHLNTRIDELEVRLPEPDSDATTNVETLVRFVREAWHQRGWDAGLSVTLLHDLSWAAIQALKGRFVLEGVKHDIEAAAGCLYGMIFDSGKKYLFDDIPKATRGIYYEKAIELFRAAKVAL